MPTTIIGDNKTTSPFQGNDSITIERTGVPQGAWVEAYIPSNIIVLSTGTSFAVEQLGWKQPDANGVVRWTFNASPTEGLVQRTALYGWVLPAGIYEAVTQIFDKINPAPETAQFEIVGDATTAITTSLKLRGKKK